MTTRLRALLWTILVPAAVVAGPADPKPPADEPLFVLGSPRFRHPGTLYYGAVAPDGKTLYTLSGESEATAWDLDSGEAKPLFTDGRLRNALVLTPDGQRLMSISQDDVAMWDIPTGKEIKRFSGSLSASFAAPRPDGKAAIIFREDRIEEWPLDGPRREVAKTTPFVKPMFSPDGKRFAAAGAGDGKWDVIVYDAQTLKPVTTLKVGSVGLGSAPEGTSRVRIAFAPDGKEVAFASVTRGLAVWDLGTAALVRELKPGLENPTQDEASFTYLLYSADGKTLFAGTSEGTVRRWDVAAGTELAPLRAPGWGNSALLLAKDGKWLVTLCRDGIIRRWDTATGKEIEPPGGYVGSVHAQASPDGSAAVLLDQVGHLDVWDLATGKRRAALRPRGGGRTDSWPAFGFLADGKRVYHADPSSGTVSIYVVDGKEESRTLVGPRGAARLCAMLPDGKTFIVGRPRTKLARITAGSGASEWVTEDLYARGTLWQPAISADGKTVFVGAVDYNVPKDAPVSGKSELLRLDAGTGKLIDRKAIETDSRGSPSWLHRPLFSADGKRVAVGYDMFEFSVFEGDPLKLVRRHNNGATALTPDGKVVLGAGLNTMTGYDADSGKQTFQVSIAPRWATSVVPLPDGRRVLTSGTGGLAYVWRLPNEGSRK